MKKILLNIKDKKVKEIAVIGKHTILEFHENFYVCCNSSEKCASEIKECVKFHNFTEASDYAAEVSGIKTRTYVESGMRNKDKLRVLEGLISMLEYQSIDGQPNSFSVWFEDLCDEQGNDFIQNDIQKQLIDKVEEFVDNISYILSDLED